MNREIDVSHGLSTIRVPRVIADTGEILVSGLPEPLRLFAAEA
jgi:hypothetical protein